MSDHPPVVARFLRYVRIDTTSDPSSTAAPSTERQKDLGRLLEAELRALGLEGVEMDAHGYVFATLPRIGASRTTVALLAHLDTSPDAPGANVQPIVHPPYEGGAVTFPADPSLALDPKRQPALLRHLGHNLITSDGSTLLGSDDKAGVAVLMQLAEDLVHATDPRPELRFCFTIDEEIGRGVDHLRLDRLGAHVAYTFDGSDVDALDVETFNAAEAVFSVAGVGVHPGYARGVMVNALRIAAAFIAGLPEAEAPETTDGRLGYYHPHGMTAADVTTAEVRVLLRDFDAEGLERRKAYLEALAEALRRRHPAARITLSIRDQYKNMRTYIEGVDARAIAFAHAAAAGLGMTLREEAVRGGTDGARLSELGVPTPNIFNGGFDYHSRFEWNTVQNLERTLRYAHALVRRWGEHG